MSTNRTELNDDALSKIAGGSIDYYPDSYDSPCGRIGINNNLTHRYSNKAAVIDYFNAHMYDRQWTSFQERDEYIFNGMILEQIVF